MIRLNSYSPVYPRRCGEQADAALRELVALRFIPAGAGNRNRERGISARGTVYPRRCGEQATAATTLLTTIGLSPQVRGTAGVFLGAVGHVRFIPAGAGNRPHDPRIHSAKPVYPRRCGEQSAATTSRSWSGGLSPQVRGTGATGHATGSPRPVYPRRCGEQAPHNAGRSAANGLSPQVRGTAAKGNKHGKSIRFIPAGAGNRPLQCA